jgi:nucleotide-binding universal stress UspA family protein
VKPSGSIVCGVDPSAGARTAARFAAILADRLTARLVLVHAVQPPIPQRDLGTGVRRTDWDVVKELRRRGHQLLEEIAQEVGRAGPEVATELTMGDATNVLSGAAERAEADLLVVGSRGLGSVKALVLGSVSLRLAVNGPCPTVIVPESGGTVTNAPVLCAVDNSEESRSAVIIASQLASRLDVGLVLAHAEHADALASSEELLARLVVESGLGNSVKRIVIPGEPADAIVGAAVTRGTELIVMGSRGRSALASATLGSVSSAVVTRAPCAVAIVRAADRSTPGFEAAARSPKV